MFGGGVLRVDYTLSEVDVFEDDIFANGCNEEGERWVQSLMLLRFFCLVEVARSSINKFDVNC